MTTAPGKIDTDFREYLKNIQSQNDAGHNTEAKLLEKVLLQVYNKCNNWDLKSMPKVNQEGIDLMNNEETIAIQVKSKDLVWKKVKEVINYVKDKYELTELIFFAPTFNKINFKKNIKYNFPNKKFNITLHDQNDVICLMTENKEYDYFIRLLDVNNFYFKTEGFYKFNKLKDNQHFFDLNEWKIAPNINRYDNYITELEKVNKLYIKADMGRGKTIFAYYVGCNYIQKGWDVIFIDLSKFKNDSIDFWYKVKDTLPPETLIIVDNCHENEDSMNNITHILNGISGVKLLFLSRYYNLNCNNELAPGKTTVEKILKANSLETSPATLIKIIKIVGNENSNLRLLSIICKSIVGNINENPLINPFQDFYNLFIYTPIGLFENKRNIPLYTKKLAENILNSTGENVFYESSDVNEKKYLEILNSKGLLNKVGEKYFFQHNQDALAFLTGCYHEEFIEVVLNSIFERCKKEFTNQDLANFFNELLYNYLHSSLFAEDIMREQLKKFISKWFDWAQTQKYESDIFHTQNIHNLFCLYIYGKNLKVITVEESVKHFTSFSSTNKNFFLNNLRYLDLLDYYSKILTDGNRCLFLDILNFSESEYAYLYDKFPSGNYIKRYINKKLNPNNKIAHIQNPPSKIQNKLYDNFTSVKENEVNVGKLWDKYLNYIQGKHFLNNISISNIAAFLDDLILRSLNNHVLFLESVLFFENNIEQIIKNTEINPLSRYLNALKNANKELYTRIINNPDLKEHLNDVFARNFSLDYVKAMEGFYHQDVPYIIEINTNWISMVDKTILNEFLEAKIADGKFIATEDSFYSFVKTYVN